MGVGDCAEGKGLEEQEGCQTLYAGEERGKEGRLLGPFFGVLMEWSRVPAKKQRTEINNCKLF